MNPLRFVAVPLTACLLSACAAHKPLPPPSISYDNGDFAPAAETPAPKEPVKIVTVPKPLPLPGQLKPLPKETTGEADKTPPTERVDKANKAARLEPSKDGYVNAVQVYPYTRGALYRLYAAPGEVSDIALQPGESLTAVSAGDTVRWVVGNTTSGIGNAEQVHILVKPIALDLTTNLVITTDRRTYHLEMVSTKDTYMAAVSWSYPEDELLALQNQNKAADRASGQVIDAGVDLTSLHFRYAISGDDPPWRPVRAFDDGHKVYIEFPARIDQGEAPPLFVVGADGSNQLVNYRVRGNFYIVDRLFAAAELRLGTKHQQVVRISRTDGRPKGGHG